MLKYQKEERVLNEILDLFREVQQFKKDLRKKIIDQMFFKLVLECVEIKAKEKYKIETMNYSSLFRYIEKK
jgi:hypothetical protein